jgi:hypothetical protein
LLYFFASLLFEVLPTKGKKLAHPFTSATRLPLQYVAYFAKVALPAIPLKHASNQIKATWRFPQKLKDPWLSAPHSRMAWLCRRTKNIFSDWESLVNQNLNLFYLIEQNMEAFEGPIRKVMILL